MPGREIKEGRERSCGREHRRKLQRSPTESAAESFAALRPEENDIREEQSTLEGKKNPGVAYAQRKRKKRGHVIRTWKEKQVRECGRFWKREEKLSNLWKGGINIPSP